MADDVLPDDRPPLTEQQIASIRRGLEQIERGEGVADDQLDGWFAALEVSGAAKTAS